MEKRKTFSSYSLLFKGIAVILVMAMMFNFTVSANAVGTQQEYVREVIVVTGKDLAEAQKNAKTASDKTVDAEHPEKKREYTVFETPVYESSETKTWLCYATTTNRNLAVTSIKAMNMRGGWSYEEYNKYLDSLWEKAGLLEKDLLVAVREYNRNLAAKSARAVYAKGIFDMLKEDYSGKSLSAFFSEMGTEASRDTETEKDCVNRMTRFIMESNINILCSIENALLVACADTYANDKNMKGSTLFDGLEEEVFLSGINGYKGYTQYDVYAEDIINSLPDLQKDLFFYSREAKVKYTAEMEELAEIVEDAVVQKGEDEGKTDEEIFETREDETKWMLEEIADCGEYGDMEFTDDQMDAAEALLKYNQYYYHELKEEQQKSYTAGRMYYAAFSNCDYRGYEDSKNNPQCYNLQGLMTMYNLNDPNVAKVNYQNSDFYPIIHLMSPGQRALLKLGFSQFVASVVNGVDVLEFNRKLMLQQINTQLEDGEEEITEKSTLSVYFGVDRSLFQKDTGVAMTSEAITASQEIPLSPDQAYYKRMERIADYIAMASGATAAVLTAVTIGCTLKLQSVLSTATLSFISDASTPFMGVAIRIIYDGTAKTSEQALLSVGGRALVEIAKVEGKNAAFSFAQYLKAFITSGGVGTVLSIVNAISIAVMIIALLVKLVAATKAAQADSPYIDIPSVMCSYERMFDGNADGGLSNDYDYIYYYGVKNPCLTKEDGERASKVTDENNKKTTDIFKFGVGDVANWTLHGANRQWVALYAANDLKAGCPILAGNFMVTSDPNTIVNGYTAVKKFNEGAAYNLQNFSSGERYLGYMMERNTASSQGASVFSDVTPIGMLVVGALAGGGLGTLITYFTTKKRKKIQTAER